MDALLSASKSGYTLFSAPPVVLKQIKVMSVGTKAVPVIYDPV